jgi:hypothetical protein
MYSTRRRRAMSAPRHRLGVLRRHVTAAPAAASFTFTPENFRAPRLPRDLRVIDVPLRLATDAALEGLGKVIHSADELTVSKGNFEIVPWPRPAGGRPLDPHTGDEAGTTEGFFDVEWSGDFFMGKNLAIASVNNTYLDGLGALPEHASHDSARGDGNEILLWMSDYHPDGGQLFFPVNPIPFVVCLGPASCGDDIKPEDMRAFYVPAGKGAYFHPGTWHNGVYVRKEFGPQRFLTRQGRVHARVSASWAGEFGALLRVPLNLD